MPSDKISAIKRAKHLIKHVHHAALATVNDDGSPHNTPLLFAFDLKLNYFYWASHPNSRHSENIARDGNVFLVVYESDHGGGLYIEAGQARALQGEALIEALKVYNSLRLTRGNITSTADFYSATNSQRMYAAKTQHFYVNYSMRDNNGNTIKDIRDEITTAELV